MFPAARTVDHEAERLKLELRLALLEGQEQAQDTFIGFSRYVWPEAIISSHHEIMASAFDRIADGTLKRLIVNMPPRHTKSEFASYLLPAYIMGRKPDAKIIQATHTGELAVRFGRKVRNLMDLDRYKEVFSGVALKADSKAAGRWDTDAGGEYFAVGVGGAMTGRGADMLIIDDPHALEVSTPIPTPRGFVEIQHLRVGDEVFGPDGKTTVVKAKSPVYEDRPLYSVLTDDGCEIICDSEHLWGVNSDTNLTKARVVSKTARELSQWSKPNKPILPRVNPVEYPKANLPIDPWVLGAWLGDGTSSNGRMTADPKTGDQEYMISEFRRLGYEVSPVTGDGWTFTVYGLHAQLKLLGVINNKHIPDVYLRGSVEQRMSLLQGLVDTDGCVSENGQAGFYNCNKNMVMAVVELLHSLGVKACLRSYDDKRERFATAKTNHRVMFRLAQCARMPRKLKNAYTPTDKRGRSIEVNALPERGSVQCITVDRADGLFLAGHGYVVTHNSEQDAQSTLALDNAWEWYTSGPRTRLQPGAAVVLVMTRWGTKDLTARLLKAQSTNNADQWEVIEFPAVFDEGEENERALWPSYWELEELRAVRASMSVQKWNAMYQQRPTADEGAILKREWWKLWEHEELPAVEYIIQSYDTAYSKKETADYSVITTWGVFFPDEDSGPNIMLMDVRKGRWDFPDLKRQAKEQYDYWQPDNVLIEAKATGTTLQQELRRMGIPVTMYSPGGRRAGQDKVSRANSVAPILESGMVWATDDDWAQDLIEECAAFPNGDNDDQVDSTTQALTRFRAGNFISLHTDQEDEPKAEGLVPEYY
jgi:predicted phage terminase large subunit-like protein